MKERIIAIIKELNFVKNAEELNISDDVLFTQAMTSYRGELVGSNKMQQKPPIKATDTSEKLATDKQIDYLKKLGYKGDLKKMTKLKAMKEISERKGDY